MAAPASSIVPFVVVGPIVVVGAVALSVNLWDWSHPTQPTLAVDTCAYQEAVAEDCQEMNEADQPACKLHARRSAMRIQSGIPAECREKS